MPLLHETPIAHTMRAIPWRVSQETNREFLRLVAKLANEAHDSDESIVLRDAIKSLPGHPHNFDPSRDIIVRVDWNTGEQL